MDVILHPKVTKYIHKLPESDQAQVTDVLDLFVEYRFTLDQKYLKKVVKDIWELRPGKHRLFFFVINPNCIIIHAMRKQSQKITKETMKSIIDRRKEYETSI